MTKLSYSIIPTWAARLPRGVGIVGGGVVGATQPRQPQEDRGQTQDRGHVTRGQGRSLCPDISEARSASHHHCGSLWSRTLGGL